MEREKLYIYGTELEPNPHGNHFYFSDLRKIKTVEFVDYISDFPMDERAIVTLSSIEEPILCKIDGFVSSMAPFDGSKYYKVGDQIKVDLSHFRLARPKVKRFKRKMDWRIRMIMIMAD